MSKNLNDNKIILVGQKGTSNWSSCKHINENLVNAYKIAFGSENTIEYLIDNNYYSNLDFAQLIEDIGPQKIVFYDHRVHPNLFLSALHTKNEVLFSSIHFIFHVYGNFLFRLEHWRETSKLVTNSKASFVFACSKMKKQFSQFFPIENSDTHNLIPYPINSKNFYFSEEVRLETRNKLKINENDRIFLYTGRLSPSKNIDQLLSIFSQSAKKNDRLILVGEFDDYDLPLYIQLKKPKYYYSQKIGSLYHSLPNKAQIEFHHQVEQNEVLELLNAADVFISLSSHPGEDFGMSVAEALSCGLPTILTNWAGYSDFASDKWSSYFVSVEISDDGIDLNKTDLSNHIEKVIPLSLSDRKKQSQDFQNHYSESSISGKIQSIKADSLHLPLKDKYYYLYKNILFSKNDKLYLRYINELT